MPMLLDAQDDENNRRVCIKWVIKKSDETQIDLFFSSQALKSSNNHCVSIHASFNDLIEPETKFIVMPLLRPFDDPEFGAVGEVVDFVTQMLEIGKSLKTEYDNDP
jgi:hypothetical protein